MPRDARIYSKWIVFIDGIQIPHLGLNLAFARNMYGTGTILVEPDPIVHEFRPNANVLVFFYDEFASGADVAKTRDGTAEAEDPLNDYRLYFEGELIGVSHAKTPSARNMALSVAGQFRIFQRHKMFQSTIGGEVTTPHFTGGFMIPSMVGDSDNADTLSLCALADSFFGSDSKGMASEKAMLFRASKDPDFADRIVSLISFLSGYNGSLRLSTVRTRLLNKIAGIPDTLMKRLMGFTLSNQLYQEMQGKVDANWSSLDLINKVCTQVFYSWYQLPGPHTPPKGELEIPDSESGAMVKAMGQPKEPEFIPLPSSMIGLEDDEQRKLFSFVRDYYRNDYVFLPEMYFAAPPPCNFLLPEDIDKLNYERNFDAEPTRVVIIDPFLSGGQSAYMAPPWLLRELDDAELHKLSASDIYATNILAFEGKGDEKLVSPYQSPIKDNKGAANLLRIMTDEEIEKGIICSISYSNMELFAAIANSSGKTLEELKGEDAVTSVDEDNKYEQMMTKLANYRYLLMNSERNATVACTGNRFIVPGFTAFICDKDASYIGFVEAVEHSVDVATTQERTNIMLSHVRYVPDVPTKAVSAQTAKKAVQDLLTDKKFVKAEEQYSKRVREVDETLSLFKDGLASMRSSKPNSSAYVAAFLQTKLAADELNTKAGAIAGSLYGNSRTNASTKYVKDRQATETMPGYIGPTTSEKVNEFPGEYLDSHLPTFPTDAFTSAAAFEKADGIYSWEGIDDGPMEDQAIILASQINDYLKFQQQLLADARETGRVPDVDTVGYADIQQTLSSIDYSSKDTAREIARLTGSFYPPEWFNQGFLKMSTIDSIYQHLLGCQPFYTVYGKEGAKPGERLDEGQVFEESTKFLQALDRIFPILKQDGIVPSTRGIGEKSKWDELTDEGEMAPGPHAWMIKNIQRRDVTSLGQFLGQHGLELTKVVSDLPSPTMFYAMAVRKDSARGKAKSQVGGYSFDNSIFSMIADEWEMFSMGDREAAAAASTGSRSDPMVSALRAKVKSPFLTREKRQEIVKRYSMRHFGSRGFDGR